MRMLLLAHLALTLALGSFAEARDLRAITAPTADFSKPEAYEQNPGGASTSNKSIDRNAFSHPSTNLTFEQRADFFIGNGFFDRLWVTAPASTDSADGLGPLYNARACQRCHLKDGRGHPPSGPDDSAVSLLMRLSVPPRTESERQQLSENRLKFVPEPIYGSQLQDFGVPGHEDEGQIRIHYEERRIELAGGEIVSLRVPTYSIEELGYGPLAADVMLSPRIAPPMIGLGLLEFISEDDVLANVDADDADGDGISGRPNRIWSLEENRLMLGRFGWKAGNPTLHQQNSEAFTGDIGISNPLVRASFGDCTAAQSACQKGPHGDSERHGGIETSAGIMDKVLFYTRNLAVPARRDLDDPIVLHGKRMFYESGCIACHRPKFITKQDASQPAQSFQLIWPYTDLLLHDMGEGLADHRPEGDASGQEWRTPPLWSIGLTETVNGHTFFLHDGRARSFEEAILWHGGEAEAMRETFKAMPKSDRDALVAFLNSL